MLWLVRLALGVGLCALTAGAIVFEQLPNTVAQCAPLSIHWALSPGEQSSPFNITVLPFASEPFNLTVTPSSNEDAGIFNTSLSIPSGVSFLLVAGNGSQATTSAAITVTPSSNSTCLGPYMQGPFFLKSQPPNCIPSLFNLTCMAFNCSDVPVVRGFVPKGQAPFPVAAVGTPAQWFISVQEETQILLEFTNADGRRVGTSQLLTVGGPDATKDCDSLVFFPPDNSTQKTLPAQTRKTLPIASRTIIGSVLGGSVGLIVLCWILFLLRRHFKRRRALRSGGIEAGSGGMRTTVTDRDWVLDSEFAATFSSVIPSSRGTAFSKAFSKSPENQLFSYGRSTVPLPMDLDSSLRPVPPLRIPTKPPPIKVPSYVPMDVAPEPPISGGSLHQGKLSPSHLPDWAQRSLSVKSTATTVKRQTRESGRVV